jgi:hypothetical protein
VVALDIVVVVWVEMLRREREGFLLLVVLSWRGRRPRMGRVGCSLGEGDGCDVGGVASNACPGRGEGSGIGVGVNPSKSIGVGLKLSRSMSTSKSRSVVGVDMIGDVLAGRGGLFSGLESSESILGGWYSGRLGICSRSAMCAGRMLRMLRRLEGLLRGL